MSAFSNLEIEERKGHKIYMLLKLIATEITSKCPTWCGCGWKSLRLTKKAPICGPRISIIQQIVSPWSDLDSIPGWWWAYHSCGFVVEDDDNHHHRKTLSDKNKVGESQGKTLKSSRFQGPSYHNLMWIPQRARGHVPFSSPTICWSWEDNQGHGVIPSQYSTS